MTESDHERLGISFGMRSAEDLARQVKRFSETNEPARARWEYCLSWLRRQMVNQDGERQQVLTEDGLSIAARFLGLSVSQARYRMTTLHRMGFELAEARLTKFGGRGLFVGPIEPWQIGHVYFACPEKAPHVMKIGFSRRVAQRIDDISSQIGQRLNVRTLRVGTMLNERWWQTSWRDVCITGEWFFDPFQDDRTVPEFLNKIVAGEGRGTDDEIPAPLATIEHHGSVA